MAFLYGGELLPEEAAEAAETDLRAAEGELKMKTWTREQRYKKAQEFTQRYNKMGEFMLPAGTTLECPEAEAERQAGQRYLEVSATAPKPVSPDAPSWS